jgi:hypothetical protein
MAIVIPIPLTQGYVNLGDAAVFVGAYLLRKKMAPSQPASGRRWRTFCFPMRRLHRLR